MSLPLVILACSSGPDVHTIQVRGSDSEVNLVQRLGEAFGDERPTRAVAVTGGGSGVGIAGLIDGNCDLANSSRALKPAEKLLALRKGVEPVATIFAADALTIIVHPDNELPSMTLAELAAMFKGERTTWPSGEPVVPFGRQSSSGTFGFFRDVVLKADYTDELRQMNGNAQIVESVARERGGIGYVAVGYLKPALAEGSGAHRVRALEIQTDEDSVAVSPLDAEAVARRLPHHPAAVSVQRGSRPCPPRTSPSSRPFPMSIFDNVAYGLRIGGIRDRDELRSRVRRALEHAALFGEVADRLEEPALGLSGGQQQRLCIARALAVEPEVLLMDEPTSALDPIATEKIESLVVGLKAEVTIVIVTHNMQQAQRIADRTAVLYLGELIEDGPTEQVFGDPQDRRARDYVKGAFG